MTIPTTAVGTSMRRLEGPAKVRGTAPYAWEQAVDDPLFVHPVQSTVARGRVRAVDTGPALAVDGVVVVLTHENAARLADTDDAEYAVLQSAEVGFRGQFVAAVVAESAETARHAANLVRIDYDQQEHDTELRADDDSLYRPDRVNPDFPTDSDDGDVAAALAAAARTIDRTYTTPMLHNNPMEPHTSVVRWDPDGEPRVTMYDSTQGVHPVRQTLAPLFGLELEQVRVVSPHVGGGFGSKGLPHAHNVLAVLAAQAVPGRFVKLALTRQQMFSLAGHRTPTIQRIRLGATEDGQLSAITHDAVEHTSRIKEFAEQSAVATRMMYAGAHRHTSHRLARLDVPVPSWMRAPGECPGMAALEIAMDELAEECGLDPIELRVRNDPESDPETGNPWSSRNLVACLREGARRFDWDLRRPPGQRREGDELVGLGVASATYPAGAMPGSEVAIEYDGSRYAVRIGAADIGTGSWTVLTQVAADALGSTPDDIALEIGDTALPPASVEGGSTGLTSWGSTIVEAARVFRAEHGEQPSPGAVAQAAMADNPDLERYAAHSFGAHFAEVRVDVDTGEVRVPRMLGVFAVGRIVNPRTARSQLIGGMTMGLSMALHEQSVLDHRTGHVVNHDFAEYHIASHADVRAIEAIWLDEEDPHVGPLGAKGIGEIGIVGSPAAVANATYNATGIRVRDLPITPDKLLPRR